MLGFLGVRDRSVADLQGEDSIRDRSTQLRRQSAAIMPAIKVGDHESVEVEQIDHLVAEIGHPRPRGCLAPRVRAGAGKLADLGCKRRIIDM